MATEIYGHSDDLIEVDGDVRGEHGAYGDAENFVIVSDGTILKIKYGKDSLAVWEIRLIEKGTLFITIRPCFDEDAPRHSDTALFLEGIKWVYVTKEIQKVK